MLTSLLMRLIPNTVYIRILGPTKPTSFCPTPPNFTSTSYMIASRNLLTASIATITSPCIFLYPLLRCPFLWTMFFADSFFTEFLASEIWMSCWATAETLKVCAFCTAISHFWKLDFQTSRENQEIPSCAKICPPKQPRLIHHLKFGSDSNVRLASNSSNLKSASNWDGLLSKGLFISIACNFLIFQGRRAFGTGNDSQTLLRNFDL